MKKKYVYLLITCFLVLLTVTVSKFSDYLLETKWTQVYEANKEIIDEASEVTPIDYGNADDPTPTYSKEDQPVIDRATKVIDPYTEMQEDLGLLKKVFGVITGIFILICIRTFNSSKKKPKSLTHGT